MRLKGVAAALLALAICCAGTACASQPPAAPSSIPATPVASLPEEPEPQTEETEKEEEETAMEHLYVADAAQYRGTVTSAKTGLLPYRLPRLRLCGGAAGGFHAREPGQL